MQGLNAAMFTAPPTVASDTSLRIALSAIMPLREATDETQSYVGCVEALGYMQGGLFRVQAVAVPSKTGPLLHYIAGKHLRTEEKTRAYNMPIDDLKDDTFILRVIYKPIKREGVTDVQVSYFKKEIKLNEDSLVKSVKIGPYTLCTPPLLAPLPAGGPGITLTLTMKRLRFPFASVLAKAAGEGLFEKDGDVTSPDYVELLTSLRDQWVATAGVNAHAERHVADVKATIRQMTEAAASRREKYVAK